MSRLLSHYWTGDDPEASRKAQIQDWIEDLIEFGSDTVAAACGEWRRGQTRRPTIADIRKIAWEINPKRGPDYIALPSPQQQESIAERREQDWRRQNARFEAARLSREQTALELGFKSFAAWMDYGLVRGAQRGCATQTGSVDETRASLGVTAREQVIEEVADA